ncbi:MAG: class I SAM-dependent methyltransferase [Nitrospirota bacterium]
MEKVSCELCGAARVEVVLRQRDLTLGNSEEEFTVVRCEACGLLFLNPRPDRTEMGRFYPPRYFADGTLKPRSELERRVKRWSNAVKRWIREDFYGYPGASLPRGVRIIRRLLLWPEKARRVFRGREILPWVGQGRLLDVGCGPGFGLAALQDQGWDVYGLDASEVVVAHAQKRFGDRVRLGDPVATDYKDREFDVVMFSHALEHMYDVPAVLREIRRILDDRGLLVITLPNAGSWEATLFGRWWFPWELPRHLYHFEKMTLARMLAQTGFRVVRMWTGVGSLFFMASLERSWTQRFGRSLPARWLAERVVARPFCLLAGHLGYGTEITVYAVKNQVEPEAKVKAS